MSMTETAPLQEDQARRALEAFITDNPELERLEGLSAQFNIFEAIGAVRHEVRHSDFLAYLLNPQGNHGLGDAFIKRLLRGVLASEDAADVPVTPDEFDAWDMGTATVQREWQRIDIFLRDELHQFSVIIENKIDTGEHDDQLSRYYEMVRREFPNDRILALYLTKEGDEPSDERYLPIGYGLVCDVVESVAERRVSTLNQDVHTLMTHYAQMLRRHIMSDTKIARLCGQIYRNHKAALDLIYEHRQSRQEEFTIFLEALVDSCPDLVRWDKYNRERYVVFYCSEWDVLKPMLYLVFINIPAEGLVLNLSVGPGDEDMRRTLFEFAPKHRPPFNYMQAKITKYFTIFKRRILTVAEYEEGKREELQSKIRDCWEQFLQHDLPAIRDVLAEGGWLNQPASSDEQLS